MRIEIIGDESISPQPRIYAEYRLFAALSQVVDTSRVSAPSPGLRRAKPSGYCGGVVCTVSGELKDGEVARIRATGDHPYAAINRAVERIRLDSWPARQLPAHAEMVATE